MTEKNVPKLILVRESEIFLLKRDAEVLKNHIKNLLVCFEDIETRLKEIYEPEDTTKLHIENTKYGRCQV